MKTIKKRVADLEGAQLDWAVAMAGEEWKTAHRHFPTMTLDSTFAGVYIAANSARSLCGLKPNNPFRQDPQEYNPSTDWAQGGPIIERERISLCAQDDGEWSGYIFDHKIEHVVFDFGGMTPLIAAMRTFVASKLGDEVEVPE